MSGLRRVGVERQRNKLPCMLYQRAYFEGCNRFGSTTCKPEQCGLDVVVTQRTVPVLPGGAQMDPSVPFAAPSVKGHENFVVFIFDACCSGPSVEVVYIDFVARLQLEPPCLQLRHESVVNIIRRSFCRRNKHVYLQRHFLCQKDRPKAVSTLRHCRVCVCVFARSQTFT